MVQSRDRAAAATGPSPPCLPSENHAAEETVWSDLWAAQKRSLLSLCGKDLMLSTNWGASVSALQHLICVVAQHKSINDQQTRKNSTRGFWTKDVVSPLLPFFFLLVYDKHQQRMRCQGSFSSLPSWLFMFTLVKYRNSTHGEKLKPPNWSQWSLLCYSYAALTSESQKLEFSTWIKSKCYKNQHIYSMAWKLTWKMCPVTIGLKNAMHAMHDFWFKRYDGVFPTAKSMLD